MGSLLELSLANAFLSYHEKKWLNNCPQGFKPVFYRRYVDDIFMLFKSNDHLKYFQDLLNFCHINMSFSMETEKEDKLSFPDVKIIREQGKFTTAIYRKPTFSGVYGAICDHLPSFDNFSILAHKNKKYLLEIKESLLIMRDKPSLNRNINSALLYLLIKSPN